MSTKKTKVKKILIGLVGTILLALIITVGVFEIKVSNFEKRVSNYEIKQADMVIDTYGSPDNPSLLLMHGMYMDGKMLAEYCMELSDDYYLIIPTYHGMEGNQETVFESFDTECRYIEDYLIAETAGHIDYAYGISMGATMIYHMLERGNISVNKAILDGIYAANQGPMAAYMTSSYYYDFHEKALAGEDFDLGIMRVSCKLMGITEQEAKDMIINDMTKNHMTLENMSLAAYANYTYEPDPDVMIKDTQIELWCGSNEPYAQKSHDIIKEHIENYSETIFDGYGHGELLSKHRDIFIEKVREAFNIAN